MTRRSRRRDRLIEAVRQEGRAEAALVDRLERIGTRHLRGRQGEMDVFALPAPQPAAARA